MPVARSSNTLLSGVLTGSGKPTGNPFRLFGESSPLGGGPSGGGTPGSSPMGGETTQSVQPQNPNVDAFSYAGPWAHPATESPSAPSTMSSAAAPKPIGPDLASPMNQRFFGPAVQQNFQGLSARGGFADRSGQPQGVGNAAGANLPPVERSLFVPSNTSGNLGLAKATSTPSVSPGKAGTMSRRSRIGSSKKSLPSMTEMGA